MTYLTTLLLLLSIIQIHTDSVSISPFNSSPFNDHKFQGFGTSFCWWANRVGYSDSLSEKCATAFYDKEKGLGLNIIRYNIGGGDDPGHHHITRTDSAIPGYWKDPHVNGGQYSWQYDWNKDSNQRNALIKAMKAAGDEVIVEAFSNSPPYFMCKSGCTSGNTNAGANNLKDDAYEEFADYLADVAEHFKTEWGINFQSITPMNEPFTNYWGAGSNKQEGCHFDQGDTMNKIYSLLRQALDKRGLNDIIMSVSDETSMDTQISSYNKLSSEVKKMIPRIDTHTYAGGNAGALRQLAVNEGKNLWMSEIDGAGTAGQNAGEMGSALWLAERIVGELNSLLPSAWIIWQVIDNHISKEGMNGNKDKGMVNVNGGFWGVAVADHDNDNVVLTMKYYAYGQFSRYIRPGYTIIGGNSRTVAAFDPKGKQVVIVAVNDRSNEVGYDFDLSQFAKVGETVDVIRTSGGMNNGEKWAKLDGLKTNGMSFHANLKGNSVTTFIVHDCETGTDDLTAIKLDESMVSGSNAWQNGNQNTYKKVVDGNMNTYFDGVADGYVQIDLGKEYNLDAIAYAPRLGFEYRMINGEFYGSTDGTTWNKLYTIQAEPAPNWNYIFKNKLASDSPVRYIKYAVPSGKPTYGHNEDSYLCNISDIKLFGEPA